MGDEYIFFARSDQQVRLVALWLSMALLARSLNNVSVNLLRRDLRYTIVPQRKPMKREKLREWYKRMLDKAKEKGIVESYGAMQDLFGSMKSVARVIFFVPMSNFE